MARNNNIIAAVIIIILALAGLGYYLATRMPNDGTPATSTPPGGTSTPPAATPPPPPTATPDAPVVTTSPNAAVSNTTAVVSGNVNPRGAQTSYWFDYGTTQSLDTANRTATQSLGSGFITIPTPALITGLNPNTRYYFRLSAQNSFGTVRGGIFSFTTASNVPPVQGTAPTTQTRPAADISRTTANISGTVNPNGSPTTHWFEYGLSTGLGTVSALQNAGNGTTTMNVMISLSNLQPQTRYYFRLNAQNQYGTVNGAILNFTTQGPPAPSAPTADTRPATGVATSTATFNARINPNGADTAYWFEYSQDALLGSILGTITPEGSAGSGYADVNVNARATGLAPDTRYYYRVTVRNAHGTVRGDIENFRTD